MIMTARIIDSDLSSLLVRDLSTDGEVRVFFRNSQGFAHGDLVRIRYNGQMTRSIPPQITATSIEKVHDQPQSLPREIRGTVIQRRRDYLTVRDEDDNRIIVNYPYAHHFCIGQRIVIRHDSVFMSDPIEINATDVIPVC